MIDPGRLTPREWAESDVRRREARERIHNAHGRELSRTARLIMGWVFATLLVAMVAVTVLGLIGVLAIFPPPTR